MRRYRGFTLIETMVGMVIGGMLLAASYAVWRTHQVESMRLGKKIELRNKLTLASKRLERSVTLAGLGLSGAAHLAKEDAVGSDTLVIYTNPEEIKARLTADASHHIAALQVDAPGRFAPGGYVAVAGGGHAELRRIIRVSGSTLDLESALANDYASAETWAMPARRDRFYSRQEESEFIHETPEGTRVVATDVKNFQVSFADKDGRSTEIPSQVRTVRYSLTGFFPAREGVLNNIVISSTAIPRNIL